MESFTGILNGFAVALQPYYLLMGFVGTVLGTAIGVLIPAVLSNGFIVLNFQPFLQQIVIGAVLVAAVYLDQLRRQRRERS